MSIIYSGLDSYKQLNAKPFDVNKYIPLSGSVELRKASAEFILGLNEYLLERKIVLNDFTKFEEYITHFIEEWIRENSNCKDSVMIESSIRELLILAGIYVSYEFMNQEEIIQLKADNEKIIKKVYNKYRKLKSAQDVVSGDDEKVLSAMIKEIEKDKQLVELWQKQIKLTLPEQGRSEVYYKKAKMVINDLQDWLKIKQTKVLELISDVFFELQLISQREVISFGFNLGQRIYNKDDVKEKELIDTLVSLVIENTKPK